MYCWIRFIISKLNIKGGLFLKLDLVLELKHILVIIVSIYFIEDLSLAILLPSAFRTFK